MDSKIKKSHPEHYFFKRADLLKLVMIMEGYPRNGGIKWSTMEYPSRQLLCAGDRVIWESTLCVWCSKWSQKPGKGGRYINLQLLFFKQPYTTPNNMYMYIKSQTYVPKIRPVNSTMHTNHIYRYIDITTQTHNHWYVDILKERIFGFPKKEYAFPHVTFPKIWNVHKYRLSLLPNLRKSLEKTRSFLPQNFEDGE